MERRRGARTDRAAGSCALGLFDPAEGLGLGVHGLSQGQAGDQVVQELSAPEAEALLGQPLLGTRLLCQHRRARRRPRAAVCAVPGETGEEARERSAGLRPLLLSLVPFRDNVVKESTTSGGGRSNLLEHKPQYPNWIAI